MLKYERQTFILKEIKNHQKVLSSELSAMLKVSEDTIRRDLKELSDSGIVVKVHGGAMASSALPYSLKDRETYAYEKKVTIAKKAVSLIKEEAVLIIDGGSTNIELIKQVPIDFSCTVFTNSLPIASLLADYPLISVIMLGGKLLKSAQVNVGIDLIHSLEEVTADICFLGTRSIHPEIGVTEIDREEAMAKKTMVASSNQVISMVISEKLNIVQPFKVCPLSSIDTLITELPPEDKLLKKFHTNGVNII